MLKMHKIGFKVKATAQEYCPESPSKSQVNKTLKRKKQTTRTTTPGELRKSIAFRSTALRVDIVVPQNSTAGEYANYIHNKKHKPDGWRKRGLGTQAKGSQADEKFIERARDKHVSDGSVKRILISEIKRAGVN